MRILNTSTPSKNGLMHGMQAVEMLRQICSSVHTTEIQTLNAGLSCGLTGAKYASRLAAAATTLCIISLRKYIWVR